MSEQMWTRRVWLTASGAVELAPGVLLPAGTYSAKWKAPAAGIAPEYVIELTAKIPGKERDMDPAANHARDILNKWQVEKRAPAKAA